MAQPITWQNVGMAPAYGATELMGMAQDQYANAFKGLGDMIQGVKNHNLAEEKANSEAQLNWFTEQARKLKPEQFTPETMNALLSTITDPAARQAAVENFGQFGDEATIRAFNQEKRQAANAEEAQRVLLRPIEVKKANQDLKLGEAQIKSEEASAASAYASANAANANAGYTRLQTQDYQQRLDDAKTAKQENALTEQMVNEYGVRIAGGENPTAIFKEIQTNPKLTAKQQVKLLDGVEALINTANRLDPVQRQEVADRTKEINDNFIKTTAAIDAQDKYNQSKFPVDPIYAQVVGQEDVNKKVKGIASTAVGGITGNFYNTSPAEIAPRLSKGLTEVAADFEQQLDIALKPLIPDDKERAAVIAEEQRSGGLYKIQSLALDTIIPTGEGKEISLSSDGKEVVDAANQMIRPYATNVANMYTRKKLEDAANIERSEAAARQANGLRALAARAKLAGTKDEQAKPNLVKSIVDFYSKFRSADAANK